MGPACHASGICCMPRCGPSLLKIGWSFECRRAPGLCHCRNQRTVCCGLGQLPKWASHPACNFATRLLRCVLRAFDCCVRQRSLWTLEYFSISLILLRVTQSHALDLAHVLFLSNCLPNSPVDLVMVPVLPMCYVSIIAILLLVMGCFDVATVRLRFSCFAK